MIVFLSTQYTVGSFYREEKARFVAVVGILRPITKESVP